MVILPKCPQATDEISTGFPTSPSEIQPLPLIVPTVTTRSGPLSSEPTLFLASKWSYFTGSTSPNFPPLCSQSELF